MNRFFFTCLLCLFLSSWPIFSESAGASLFKKNKPAVAIPLLESGIENGSAESEDYNFLGLAYYQVGNYEKSLAAFEAGFLVAGTNKKILAYNAGNTAFAMQDYGMAEEYFSLALIAAPDFKEAVLNRANTRLRQDNYSGALEDYKHFMEIAADDINAPTVSQMIIALSEEIKQRVGDELLESELERRRHEREGELDHEIIDENEIPSDKADDAENSVPAEAVSDESLGDDGLAEENSADDNAADDDLENSVSREAVKDEPLEDGVFGGDGMDGESNKNKSQSGGDVNLPMYEGEIVPEKLDADMLWLPDSLD